MVVETYEIGQPAAEHLVKGGGEVGGGFPRGWSFP